MRSPSALEIARFLQKAAEGDFLVSYCLSGVHKNWYIIRAMRQNSKKGIDKSLFRVYSRVVKWIHYHRLDIKIKKDAAEIPGILRFRADPSRTKKGCEGTARRQRLCTMRCSWGRSECQSWVALIKWIHYISLKEDPQYVSSNHHPTFSSLRGRHVRV